MMELWTETPWSCTVNWLMRDVQKGATLPDGGTGGVPQRNFLPFPKRKGNKGMVGMFVTAFDGQSTNFLYKAK